VLRGWKRKTHKVAYPTAAEEGQLGEKKKKYAPFENRKKIMEQKAKCQKVARDKARGKQV